MTGCWSMEVGHPHQITDSSEEVVLGWGGFPRRMRCQPSGSCVRNWREDREGLGKAKGMQEAQNQM